MTSRYFRSLLALACALTSIPAPAQTINVSVSGSLQQSACTPNLVGSLAGGNIITLGNVKTTDLDVAGKSAGEVELHFRAIGCTGNVNYLWVHFTSPNVDANGRMIPTSGTSKVRFEIRDHTASGSLVRAGGSAGNAPTPNQGTVAPFSGSHPADSSREANKYYVVRYYAHEPVSDAGTVFTTATAHFKYY